MLLDDKEMLVVSKALMLSNDFLDNLDTGKFYFTKQELDEMLDVYKIVSCNDSLKGFIDKISEIRKNTYNYIKNGYKNWEKEKNNIIQFIKK